jgi:uncharacterized RDD family membrane protein YckC
MAAQPMFTAPSAVPLPPGVELSPPMRRLGAHFLDFLLVIVTLFIGWLIWSIVIWKNGQSPAKSILKMRVVKMATGEKATRGTMALRELVAKLVLSIFGIVYAIAALWLLWDPNRQTLWDKMVGTTVVNDPNEVL